MIEVSGKKLSYSVAIEIFMSVETLACEQATENSTLWLHFRLTELHLVK